MWRDLHLDLALEFASMEGGREPYWAGVGLSLRRRRKTPESTEASKPRKDAWWKANSKWVNAMRRVQRARKAGREAYAKAREENPNMTKAERWAAWQAANGAWRCEAQRAERLKKSLSRLPRPKVSEEVRAQQKAAWWAANRERFNAEKRRKRAAAREASWLNVISEAAE